MNWKIVISFFIIGILSFLLGWFGHDILAISDSDSNLDVKLDTIKSTNAEVRIIAGDSLEEGNELVEVKNEQKIFDSLFTGKFLLEDANCAGFNFISATRVSWTDEINCGYPDTLRIRWLDNKTFYTQNLVPHHENCPPKVSIYKVIHFDGIHLSLKDIWTGWVDQKEKDQGEMDDQLDFVLSD